MIRDLLDVAGMRLGRRPPLRPQVANLDETCQAALMELRAAHPKRTFEYEAAGDLRGRYDPERIGQVLSNLLNNAVNHGERGQPVRLRVTGNEGSALRVEVENRGKTLTASDLGAIMDPAARKKLTGSEGSSGLGLGLYIARDIAEAHGGSVRASSTGGTTTFCLELPRGALATPA
jgi:signal transduction histidine kinase